MSDAEPHIMKYTEALKEATEQALAADPNVFVVGLGVSYKNGADGTTAGLASAYPDRVLDVPVSEDAFTGMAVGAAIHGLRPIVHHGRVEFALFAADQIITQAAKWNYMFGGDNPVPIVFRINVGRQWGNGPQHTQALYGLFGSALGLKVVVPSTPYMAKGLLTAAIKDDNPIVILEPRWLFPVKQEIPAESYDVPLDKAQVVQEGEHVTIVSYGDGLMAARQALALIGDAASVELIDLVSINPVDYETVFASVRKTKRLITVDTAPAAFSPGADVTAKVAQAGIDLDAAPLALSAPAVPCPTSTALTESYYPTKVDVANAVLAMFRKQEIPNELTFEELHLPPSVIL